MASDSGMYFSLPVVLENTNARYLTKENIDNSLIDFARYWDEEYEFPELNNIQVPLFMRWGDTFEMIEQKAPKLVEIVKNKISNENLDIGYIAGANHGYAEHEQELANEILEFFKNRR